MTTLAMPSSRADADRAFMRSGANALSGRTAAGNPLSGQPRPENALAVGYAPVSASPPQMVNRLTGQSAATPPVITPPPAIIAAPSRPPIAPPAGQRLSAIVESHLKPRELSPTDIAARIRRVEFVRNALGSLLKKPKITHADCVDLVQAAIKAGAVPDTEAGEILGSITNDPTKLRAEMEHRYKIALHVLVLLHGEQQTRATKEAS